MSARRKLSHRLTMTVLAWIVGLLIFFPILWTVLTSFKSELDAFAIPPKFLFFHWTLENYGVVQERSNYIGAATNSILLSIGANLVGLAIAVPAAWSMAFAPTIAIDRRETRVMYVVMLAGIAVTVLIAWLTSFPLFTSWWGYVLLAVIVGLPVISWIMTRRTTDVLMWMLSTKMMPGVGVLVPIYLLYRDYHLIDTRLGVGFLLMMVNLPIIIWMLYTYFKEIPVDILEAARMDGASLLNEIVHVLTPMATPGIASTMLLSIILSWYEAFWTLRLTTTHAAPLTFLIAEYSSPEGLFWAKLSAASTLAIAPIIVLGWFSQKQLVRGLTFGAVK